MGILETFVRNFLFNEEDHQISNMINELEMDPSVEAHAKPFPGQNESEEFGRYAKQHIFEYITEGDYFRIIESGGEAADVEVEGQEEGQTENNPERCPSCGKMRGEGENFCPNCGYRYID